MIMSLKQDGHYATLGFMLTNSRKTLQNADKFSSVNLSIVVKSKMHTPFEQQTNDKIAIWPSCFEYIIIY